MSLTKRILFLAPLKNDENRLKTTIRILGFSFIVILIFSVFKVILQYMDLYQPYRHPASESLDISKSMLELFTIVFLSVIVHPLIEEFSFRYWISDNRNRFLLGLGFCVSIIMVITFDIHKLWPIDSEISYLLTYILIGLPIGFLLLKFCERVEPKPYIFLLIIISSGVFALLHLNVVGPQDNLLAYLIILLPYFIGGYLYGFVSYRIGFFYSFLMHSMHNFTLLTLGLFFRYLMN